MTLAPDINVTTLIDPVRSRAIAMLASCFGRPREIIRLLLDGRAAEIQARASDAVRERMFAERLDLPWRDRTRDLRQR
jgi:hypothetical protein